MSRKSSGLSMKDVSTMKPYSLYLDQLLLRRQSPNTIRSILFAMRHLVLFQRKTRKTLRDITTDDLYRFRESLDEYGLGPLTVYHVVIHLLRFFKWLAETGKIFTDPYIGANIRKPQRRMPRIPTEREMRILLAQPDSSTEMGVRDRAIIELAYSSAIRLEELTKLSLTDPDLEKGMLRVLGKGRKERVVPLGRQAVYWLRNYICSARPRLLKGSEDTGRLWLGCQDGIPLGDFSIRAMIGSHSRNAGLERISPHAIRRACATHMLANGAHPVQLQQLLGHSDLKTLSHYLRLTIVDLKQTHSHSNPGR